MAAGPAAPTRARSGGGERHWSTCVGRVGASPSSRQGDVLGGGPQCHRDEVQNREGATGRAAENRRQDAELVLGKAALILPRQRSACCPPAPAPACSRCCPAVAGPWPRLPPGLGRNSPAVQLCTFPQADGLGGVLVPAAVADLPGWVLLQESVSYPESRRHNLRLSFCVCPKRRPP